jgi:hypothetical protein
MDMRREMYPGYCHDTRRAKQHPSRQKSRKVARVALFRCQVRLIRFMCRRRLFGLRSKWGQAKPRRPIYQSLAV